MSVQEVLPIPNGESLHRTRGSRDMGNPVIIDPLSTNQVVPPVPSTPASPTPPTPKVNEMYSCTLPIPRKPASENRLATLGKYCHNGPVFMKNVSAGVLTGIFFFL